MTTTATDPAPPVGEAIEVPLRDVERELDRQLKQAQGPGEAPVVRARMSNLMIFCDDAAAAGRVAAEVPAIVAIHPARVLLLVSEPGRASDTLTATVQTRVHRVGSGLRAFSELITLRGDGASGRHLGSAVLRLFVGDLPINLWWAAAQPPALAGALLHDLAEEADQVIYDSLDWPEPARGLSAMSSWLERFERGPGQGRYRVASDLTWRRLKPWRSLVAQALDPLAHPGILPTVTEVLVEHGPHSVLAAWGLASWLTLWLGGRVAAVRVQPGVEISWTLDSPQGPRQMRIRRLCDRPPGIHRVRVGCVLCGGPGALDMVPEGDRRLSILPVGGPDAAPRTVAVGPQPLAELVGRQLSDRERDPVFRQTMAVAQALAQSVLR
jgi:glucose-6-phosphate dehydrogenase assembly protein OpcA